MGALPSCGRTPVRHGVLRMQTLPTGGSELEASNEQGNTFWATLDGRDKDGISPDGMVPPGDDLIETDLKRVFSIDPDEDGVAGDSGFSDLDEVQVPPTAEHQPIVAAETRWSYPPAPPHAIRSPAAPRRPTRTRTRPPAHPLSPTCLLQLMYKLRKELGETDFNRIFNDKRVKGFDIDW